MIPKVVTDYIQHLKDCEPCARRREAIKRMVFGLAPQTPKGPVPLKPSYPEQDK